MTELMRRTFLAGSALAAAASTLTGLAPGRSGSPAEAAALPAERQAAGVYRYKVGEYELTALHDGTWYRPVDDKFVGNVPLPAVQKVMTDSFLPTDKLPIPFTTLLVNTGRQLVLLDTGTAGQLAPTAGTMMRNLVAAGVKPEAIDMIVISHFHPDHINGIKTKDDDIVFPNAEILVPEPEWAYWMDDAKMGTAPDAVKGVFRNVRRVFNSIAKNVRRFEPGREVAPGITSIPAYGHTPGHTAFAVASGGQSMLVLSDTTNHPWLFVRNPEWQVTFDMDGNMAVDNRKHLLDRAAADKMLVQGYHFPFPASGHIQKTASGYDFVPIMWDVAL